MGGVLSLFLRPFARLRWIALAGLSLVVRLGTVQELDLRPLPLPQSEFLTSPSIASPPSSDTEEKQDPRPKRTHEAVQTTPGQKLKVTARGVKRCSAVDPAPGPALLPTGPRRFLVTERSRPLSARHALRFRST